MELVRKKCFWLFDYQTNLLPSPPAGKFDAILADNGVNLARIRIWTSTNDEDYSLAYGLELAKRAVDLGMSLLIGVT